MKKETIQRKCTAFLFMTILLLAVWSVHTWAQENTTPADGTYSITGNLKNAVTGQNSMGDAALQKPMTLVVKNGSCTLQMEFVPLTAGVGSASFTGYLAEISYFSGWKGGSSGKELPEGEVASAVNIISYYDGIYDSYNDVNSATDSTIAGKLYPHQVSFPVSAYSNEIWMQVYVPVMEAISAGNGKQYAILNLDWSSITKISETTADTADTADNVQQETETAEAAKTEETVQVNRTGLYHMLWSAVGLAAKTNLYTADSIEALKESISTAKKIYINEKASQEQVDAQTENLSEAILNLVEKTAETLEINSLSDGTYYLYGKMQKTDKKTLSMANEAIDHTIKLTVKNGKYYLTIEFEGLTVNSQKGYLSQLQYFTNSYTLDSYGIPTGNKKNVTVETYQKNTGGKIIKDQYGSKYPARVTFPLIEKAKKNGYVPLQVLVPIMEAISKGSGTQVMYLKLDLSSITADKSNVSEQETDSETTETAASSSAAGTAAVTGAVGTATAGTATTANTAGTATAGTAATANTAGTATAGTATAGTATAGTAATANTAGTTGTTNVTAAANTAGTTSKTAAGDAVSDSGWQETEEQEKLVSQLEMMESEHGSAEEIAAEQVTADETIGNETAVNELPANTGQTAKTSTAKSTSVMLSTVMSILVAVFGVLYKVKSRMY